MLRACRCLRVLLFGVLTLEGASVRSDDPATALGFVDFQFPALQEEALAAEYYFEQGGTDRVIVRFFRPKKDVASPSADLKDFRFIQAEYFLGDWFVVADEADGFKPSHAVKRPKLKHEYTSRFIPFFLAQEKGADIEERPGSRCFIKKLGTVPIPEFPADVLALFRQVAKD